MCQFCIRQRSSDVRHGQGNSWPYQQSSTKHLFHGMCVPSYEHRCTESCQSTTYEALKMTPLPEAPWCELSTDFYGPLPSGEYLLVIIDDYSRFPVVELVRSTSANTVIPVLDKVLSTFGTPDILKSENGAPFNSGQFHSYAENMGFKHRSIGG